jgi:hypothetical protein
MLEGMLPHVGSAFATVVCEQLHSEAQQIPRLAPGFAGHIDTFRKDS